MQKDFLGYVPRLITAITELVLSAVTDAEVLECSFLCLATVLKHLHAHILDRVPSLLNQTRRLRYADSRYVRCFAAQVLGFLLRKAQTEELKTIVVEVLMEVVIKSTEFRVHGAGLLLAEAVLGPQNGLHSRSAVLLRLLLNIQLPAEMLPAGVNLCTTSLLHENILPLVVCFQILQICSSCYLMFLVTSCC